jgi:D-alanine-D-alanine ligase-like ATP-grasp enzyme
MKEAGMKLLLLDEDWVQTIYVAHELAARGCDVHILTSAAAGRAPYKARGVHQRSAPSVDSPGYLSFVDDAITEGKFDRVLLFSETIQGRVWDAAPPWIDIAFPSADQRQKDLLRDKQLLSEYLALLGVRVPRIIDASDDAAIGHALRELGAPIVVKGTEGNGGSTVRFASDERDVRAVVDELTRATGHRPFIQQYIDGPTFLAGGLFVEGQPVRLYAAEMLETFPVRVGPSLRHRTTHDPDLLRQMLAAMKALHWTGLAEGNFIRAANGEYYFLEVNPRPWGSIAVTLRAGVDLFTPLLQVLGGEKPVPDLEFADKADLAVFPQRLLAHFRLHGFGMRACAHAVADLRSWRAVPWTRPRLVMHLTRWLLHRFRDKRNRSRASVAAA